MARTIGMIVLALGNIITTTIYLFICFIFFDLLKGHFETSVVIGYGVLAGVWLILDGLKWFAYNKILKNSQSKWNYYHYIFAVALFPMTIMFPLRIISLFPIMYLIAGITIDIRTKKFKS